MSTFVWVHGAWHGGWCWHKVVQRLAAKGHRALAPDMPGRGRDEMPIADVTLDHIVARIGDSIADAGEKVVLVGHSYGGAMITQAAELNADRIERLVYVTAFLLEDGQALMDLAREDDDSRLNGQVDFLDGERTAVVREAVLRECFYGDCSDEDVAFARTRLGLEAVAGFRTPMRTSAARFGRLPRTYVECLKDNAISIGLQRRMQRALPCDKVVTLDTDHSPFFSAPDALVTALTEG
jgi:pimeloyl-ACP methyl ester carboxylesterase